MSEVPRVRTPLDERDLSDVLAIGHRAAFDGADPSPARLSVAWAQVCQETGRGKLLWNNDFGNLTAGPEWTGDWWTYESEESELTGQAKLVRMHFRAYATPECGAADYWRRLAGLYASALPFFDRGDGEGAAVELHRLRYYTGDVTAYARALRLLAAEWFSRVAA